MSNSCILLNDKDFQTYKEAIKAEGAIPGFNVDSFGEKELSSFFKKMARLYLYSINQPFSDENVEILISDSTSDPYRGFIQYSINYLRGQEQTATISTRAKQEVYDLVKSLYEEALSDSRKMETLRANLKQSVEQDISLEAFGITVVKMDEGLYYPVFNEVVVSDEVKASPVAHRYKDFRGYAKFWVEKFKRREKRYLKQLREFFKDADQRLRPSELNGKKWQTSTGPSYPLIVGNDVGPTLRFLFSGIDLDSINHIDDFNALYEAQYEGKTTDEMRAIKRAYPHNLNTTQILTLISQAKNLKRYLNEQIGEHTIITDDVTLFNVVREKGSNVDKLLSGKFDLLAVDSHQNLHVIDIKTIRTEDPSRQQETIVGYQKQLAAYKELIESQDPSLKDSVKTLSIFALQVKYPFNKEGGGLEEVEVEEELPNGDTVTYKVIHRDGVPLREYKDVEVLKSINPRSSSSSHPTLLNELEYKELEFQFQDIGDVISMEHFIPGIEGTKAIDMTPVNLTEAERTTLSALDLDIPISTVEIIRMSQFVMKEVSGMIDDLQTDPDYNEHYFGESFSKYDFTKMSRTQILRTVSAKTLITWIMEEVIGKAEIPDKVIAEKVKWLVDNPAIVIEAGYSKLLELEGWAISVEGEIEGTDSEIDDTLGLKEEDAGGTYLEKYQIGEKQLSFRSTLSAEVKRVIDLLVETDEKGNVIRDEMGLPKYVNSTEACNILLTLLWDSPNVDRMIEVMKDNKELHSWINPILEKIESDSRFKSMFFRNFRRDKPDLSSVYEREDMFGRGTTKQNNILTTSSPERQFRNKIRKAFQFGEIPLINPTKGTITGEGTANIDAVRDAKGLLEALKKAYDITDGRGLKFSERKSEIIQALENLLNALNIPYNREALNSIAYHSLNKKKSLILPTGKVALDNIPTFVDSITNEAYYIIDELEKHIKEGNKVFNPLTDSELLAKYNRISKVIGMFTKSQIEHSIYHNGKTYYVFNTPSYAGKMFSRLGSSLLHTKKAYDTFIEENFGKYRWFKEGREFRIKWLKDLKSNVKNRRTLSHKVQLDYLGTEYKDLSEQSYMASIISEFFYLGWTSFKTGTAYYRMPIMSNKPSSEFVKFSRYSVDTIVYELKDVFYQELDRIETVLRRYVNISDKGALHKNFDLPKGAIQDKELSKRLAEGNLTANDIPVILALGKGASFHFLPFMNELDVSNQTHRDILTYMADFINATRKEDVDTNSITRALESVIEVGLDTIIKEELERMRELNLFEIEVVNGREGIKDAKFKHLPSLGSHEYSAKRQMKEAAARGEYLSEETIKKNMIEFAEFRLSEFIANDMFASINLTQILATDLAYYKDSIDFQKRAAQFHSPGTRLDITAPHPLNPNQPLTDGTSRAVVIADKISQAKIYAQVEGVLQRRFEKLPQEKKKDTEFVKTYEAFKKSVLDALSEVNVADGQAFSSPTSYMKKMVMLGAWGEAEVEAFKRIREAIVNKTEADFSDLQVLMQPIKPFVYSSSTKNNNQGVLGNLKVNLQHKNSEYMLYIADALLRGSENPESNILSAIFEFMEESHYDGNGNYRYDGIDTVMFESCVKVGVTGVVDLNDPVDENGNTIVSSKEEIKTKIKNKVYTQEGAYDNVYVQEFPFEDYSNQQEVPGHFQDGDQLFGSQARILMVNDFPPEAPIADRGKKGEKATAKELIDEYFDLHAQNIYTSWDKLKEALGLNEENPYKANQKLSHILKEAIKKDAKYSPDLVRAVSLNERGEFLIPLNDPIHSTQIQQLINSIIKNRINKQRISGGPVVQATGYGLTKSLDVIFKDSNGRELPTRRVFERFLNNRESFSGQENTEEYKYLAEMVDTRGFKTYEDYIRSEGRAVAHYEAILPVPSEELEKAMTKADGSLLSIEEALKLGILNPEQLNMIGYRIPTENKYSMVPIKIVGFSPRVAGEVVMLPDDITAITGSDFDIDKMYIAVKSFSSRKIVLYDKIIESLKEDYPDTTKEDFDRIVKAHSTGDRSELQGKEDRRLLIEVRRKARNPYYFKTEFNEITDMNTTEGRDNRLIDISLSLLTSEYAIDEMFNPGNFDPQKKISRIVNILEAQVTKPNGRLCTFNELKNLSIKELDALMPKSSNKSILRVSSQTYYHQQNMIAAKLIGIFANHNVSHAFLSMQDIKLNLAPENEFEFAGVKIGNGMKLDPVMALDGMTYVSKNIAGFLSASVDAVKDPVLNSLNLNPITSGPAMLLARLGFSVDDIGLFMSQPILKRLITEYNNRATEGATITTVITEYLEKLGESTSIMYSGVFNGIDMGKLSNRLSGKEDSTTDIDVVIAFKRLYDMSTQLNTMTFLTKFNSTSNSVGPLIADTLAMKDRIAKFEEMASNETLAFNVPPSIDGIPSIIANNPILKAFYETTVGVDGASSSIFGRYFQHESEGVRNVLNTFSSIVKTNFDARTINTIINHLTLYAFTASPKYTNSISEDSPVVDTSHDSMMYYTNGGKDASGRTLTELFNEVRRKYPNNQFLNRFTITNIYNKTSGGTIDVLEAHLSGMSKTDMEILSAYWEDLFRSGDADTIKLANDLFTLSIIKNGFTYHPNGWGHIANIMVKLQAQGYVEAIRDVKAISDLFSGQIDTIALNFIEQFVRNNSHNRRVVPMLSIPSNIPVYVGANKEIELDYDGHKPYLKTLRLNDGTVSKYFVYNRTLYRVTQDNNIGIKAEPLSTLGIKNTFLEYNADRAHFSFIS